MSQTALLHVNGNLISEKLIERYEAIFQSSSPSYVMMAGMDSCIRLLEKDGNHYFNKYVQRLTDFQKCLFHSDSDDKEENENILKGKGLEHLKVCMELEAGPEIFAKDISKILIFTGDSGRSGKWLYDVLLYKYHLQLEMAAGDYALAMTSMMDTDEGMRRLLNALYSIDAGLHAVCSYQGFKEALPKAITACSIFEAEKAAGRRVGLAESIGCISKEYAYLYPPGCPLIVPGEEISNEVIALLEKYRLCGFTIEGLQNQELDEIEVMG